MKPRIKIPMDSLVASIKFDVQQILKIKTILSVK